MVFWRPALSAFPATPETLCLHNDVTVLDIDRKRLGHERPLGQRLAVLDDHRIGANLDTRRIEIGLPVADVELPAVPGTPQHFADPRAVIDAGLGGCQPGDAYGLVERGAFVRAAVE